MDWIQAIYPFCIEVGIALEIESPSASCRDPSNGLCVEDARLKHGISVPLDIRIEFFDSVTILAVYFVSDH